MATIKNIADACGVSKATVSRYINGSGYVSVEVGERIAAKIEELNYVPSATARNLSKGTSNVIGVVIPEVNNPFFAEIFKGISQVADQHDLSIFYCDTDNDADKELRALSMLRSYDIKGIILTPATGGLYNQAYSNEFIESVANLNVPVVLLDRDVPYVNWDGVFVDNFKGAYELTSSLVKAGHKNIGTITGDMALMIGRERLRGFKEVIKAAGIKMNPDYILEGDFSTATAYTQMKKILEEMSEVTAVFSPNNLTTMGVLKAIFEKGLRIPEDIAIVGFDDIELLQNLNINLTVVHRDTNEMGRRAMALLVSRISEGANVASNMAKRIILEPKVIIRGSERKI